MITQSMLNVVKRNEAGVNILMYMKDDNINISSISTNDENIYARTSSLIDINAYAPQAMATNEPNLWVLDGTFFNPNAAGIYDMYLSDSMSDDNGDFATNPTITLTLSSASEVNNLSVILNHYIPSAYPKQLKFSLLNTEDTEITNQIITLSDIDSLPNIIVDFAGTQNVKKVVIEYIGTQLPNRRARLAQIMFGTLQLFDPNDIIKVNIKDKASYIADSISSKILTFNVTNYDKRYNIDNPITTLPDMNFIRNSDVVLIWTYKDDNNAILYDTAQHFKLMNTITNDDDTVTFECGSILDAMVNTYDKDVYTGAKTVGEILNTLLAFEGQPQNSVIYDNDFNNVRINVPLPNIASKNIIQKLAFSTGATLLPMNDGTIRFANINLYADTNTYLSYDNLLSIPAANELPYTSDISIVTYDTTVDEEETKLVTATINTVNATIKYSAAKDAYVKTIIGGSVQDAYYYTDHCDLVVNFVGDSCVVEIWGKKLNTTSKTKKTATNSTLMLDSGMTYKDENFDTLTNKFIDWYSKRFKYTVKTRGEPLIRAGNIITIQTPFSQRLKCYVLENEITFEQSWSGNMSLIALNR